MGADLYIKKIYDPNQKKYQPLFDEWVALRNKHPEGSPESVAAQKKVSYYYLKLNSKGYFRDSYNGTSILNLLGLSWWQDFDKYIDGKQGDVSVASARKFLALVRSLPLQEVTAEWLKEQHCKVDDGKNSPEEWNKSFREHRAELIKFFETAIKLGEAITASI